MENTNKYKLLMCTCSNAEHQLIISKLDWNSDDDLNSNEKYPLELCTTIHLTILPFFKRCLYAIKYIFGYQSGFGAFNEAIFDVESMTELRDYINEILIENKTRNLS